MKFIEKIPVAQVLTWVICSLMIVPILIVMTVSFGKSSYMIFPPTSFSLRWYDEFFSSPEWMSSLGSSLLIAILASAIATTLGFLGAYSLVRGRYGHKKLIVSFCLLPLIVPTIITSVALYFASVPLELVGSKVWIAVCHSSLALPIVLLILISTLQGIDISVERAAESLGASRTYTFLRVILPMTAPGVVSAAFFSFLTSFDELVISLFLSGVETETLPVRIWNSLVMNMEPVIASISSFLIILTVALLLLELAVRRVRA
ncbi:Inner membrane ABC transporter permease protein YdcV [Pandoraea eparura]|uniref:Inner membrane ABC transporter permease protein YdcV n=1 Tax=Pandoraea eparura TaxID=2508291 RepID=A0A5E4REF6_9BURK|nr:ABC transporter permease [Pandoraea eparura]VVD61203.1 Inner membrane ABC transporter permease protein YdcV [Pandoraea eparura]